MGQRPSISSITQRTASPSQNQKLELAIDLVASYQNPYDYEQIWVKGIFTAPSGEQFEVDGFYQEEYSAPSGNGSISPTGNNGFFIRFSPPYPGNWTYSLKLEDQFGTDSMTGQTIQVAPPDSQAEKGFVRIGPTNYLQFDNGEQFIPIGQNIGWPNGNPYLDYSKWLTKLKAEGANFFRIWNCNWGLSLEWTGTGYQGLKQYRQDKAAYLDWLFDFASSHEMYAMLCLQHHGQVSTQVNPQWGESPYNQVNGGMCVQTWDFFTDPSARQNTKNRLRYLVARYGYSRSILAWELFNEVDWTDDYETHQSKVADWHEEMAEFIKEIDPRQHLVTTSFAEAQHDPLVWVNPNMDFTQTHFYAAIPNLERTLAKGIQDYLADYDKPTFTGEFGIRTSGGGLRTEDPDGIHLHNSIWGSFFAGGLGSGMTWWWDNYIHPGSLYYHYTALSKKVKALPLVEKDYRSTPVQVIGSSGDLTLNPTQGWGLRGTSPITIQDDGSLLPETAEISEYLYGAQWNTQFRNPPVFMVNYPSAGEFTVRTGTNAGQDPSIVITLDGNVLVQENAATNQEYSIQVPAGSHSIGVSNQGTDWITIAGYTFTGLGSALDVYALRSADSTQLAAWVLNHQYNHVEVKENGPPAPVIGAKLMIPGFAPGTYYAKWYNCMSGGFTDAFVATTENDSLEVKVPPVNWDLLLIVDTTEAPLSQVAAHQPQAHGILAYPNPVKDHSQLNLSFEVTLPGIHTLSWYDLSGRQLAENKLHLIGSGHQNVRVPVPPQLSPGHYWLSIHSENIQAGTMVVIAP